MLEASKIMRKWQTEEYGDVSEAGRKVDCLFMFDGIELSNLEIKHPDISKNELGIQNKKNIRLARCIQEAHVALGVKDACVIMADVCGKLKGKKNGYAAVLLLITGNVCHCFCTIIYRVCGCVLPTTAHG